MKKIRYFYDVHYEYKNANDQDYFHIGYFSSLKKAKDAIDTVKDQPGFKDSGGKFETNKFAVIFPYDVPDKSKVTLYEVSHEYEDAEGYDNWIIFGVYATKEEAEAELAKERLKLPYKKYPDGFLLTDIQINLLGWREGFVSWDND